MLYQIANNKNPDSVLLMGDIGDDVRQFENDNE